MIASSIYDSATDYVYFLLRFFTCMREHHDNKKNQKNRYKIDLRALQITPGRHRTRNHNFIFISSLRGLTLYINSVRNFGNRSRRHFLIFGEYFFDFLFVGTIIFSSRI